MSTRRALASLLALLVLSSFWPLACTDGTVDPDGGPGAAGGQPSAVVGQGGAGGGAIASTMGGAGTLGGNAGAAGGSGVMLPLGGAGMAATGGVSSGGSGASGAAGVVMGGPKVPESAWVDVPLPIKGELKVLPDVASLEPIFVWEPCESGIPGCEHARVVWQQLDPTFKLVNGNIMRSYLGETSLALTFRGSCGPAGYQPPVPTYPLVANLHGKPSAVLRTFRTDSSTVGSLGLGHGKFAIELVQIDDKIVPTDPDRTSFVLATGSLTAPASVVVSSSPFSDKSYTWFSATGVFSDTRLAAGNSVFVWSFPLDGGNDVTTLFGKEWQGVANEPRPMGDDWAIWGEEHAPGRIFISDGVTPARLLVANDDGHRNRNVVVAGSQLAWLKGIGEIQEVLGEYERFELWAADFDPDPAKIVPHKVRDMPLGKLPSDEQTTGGSGLYAIVELSVLQLTSLVDGTQRQLDYGEWGIADLMGLTEEHVYMAMRPDSGKNACNDLFRQRIVDVPVVP